MAPVRPPATLSKEGNIEQGGGGERRIPLSTVVPAGYPNDGFDDLSSTNKSGHKAVPLRRRTRALFERLGFGDKGVT